VQPHHSPTHQNALPRHTGSLRIAPQQSGGLTGIHGDGNAHSAHSSPWRRYIMPCVRPIYEVLVGISRDAFLRAVRVSVRMRHSPFVSDPCRNQN